MNLDAKNVYIKHERSKKLILDFYLKFVGPTPRLSKKNVNKIRTYLVDNLHLPFNTSTPIGVESTPRKILPNKISQPIKNKKLHQRRVIKYQFIPSQ